MLLYICSFMKKETLQKNILGPVIVRKTVYLKVLTEKRKTFDILIMVLLPSYIHLSKFLKLGRICSSGLEW